MGNHQSESFVEQRTINLNEGITLKKGSYTKIGAKAIFIDPIYGEFPMCPSKLFAGQRHPKRRVERILKTKIEKYGSLALGGGGIATPFEETNQRLQTMFPYLSIIKETYKAINKTCTIHDKDYGIFEKNLSAIFYGECIGHPKRGRKSGVEKRNYLTAKEINDKIQQKYPYVSIIESSYDHMNIKCKMVDELYGEFEKRPSEILYKKGCIGHPNRSYDTEGIKRRLSIDEVESLIHQHNPNVTIIPSSYTKTQNQCTFFEQDYGYFTSTPKALISGSKKGHEGGTQKRARETFIKNYGFDHPCKSPIIRDKINKKFIDKYGVKHPMQTHEVALKSAKKQHNIYQIKHWKTQEICDCVASYEAFVCLYLNKHQINYHFQNKTFTLCNGRTYRPDFYLPDQNIWIETKGWMRKNAQAKWEEFHNQIHPNSELWNEKILLEKQILPKNYKKAIKEIQQYKKSA